MASFDSIQLSLFGNDEQDLRPLPLITADKWNFPLQHYEPSDDHPEYLYSVQDWIAGLTGSKGNTRRIWNELRSFIETDTLILPYQTKGGVFQMDFGTAKVLYGIAQELRPMKKRPQLDEIRAYLVDCGVAFDNARRDPQKAAELVDALNRHHQTRLEGVVSRNDLTTWLRQQFGKGFAFGNFTNQEYIGLFGRKGKEISEQSGKKNARDGMTTEGLLFVAIVESSCLRLFKGRNSVAEREAFEIVRAVAEPLGANVQALQQQLGIDLATGRALIGA